MRSSEALGSRRDGEGLRTSPYPICNGMAPGDAKDPQILPQRRTVHGAVRERRGPMLLKLTKAFIH